ncbi:hypothetical protein M011DRAFT_495036 [Sporormia fimetaria CBS 119925]|uniref:RING-type domain-containing protein n=1 Tax=Sporormia fimetaria CBS 119925 TaxID=1340428 RepID=A0A6A6V914_9PLEO|nr:hypothetical protein M011DRAFT_495036 [Sporormia fimetaria CBS 119925]
MSLSPTFLDHILNPILTTPNASGSPPPPLLSLPAGSRHSQTMSNSRPSRLPNGYVDLTGDHDASPEPVRRRPRSTISPEPSSKKRLKLASGVAASGNSENPFTDIEEIDLSDDRADLQEILQKQRAEAVKAQEKPTEEATTFNTFNCVVCMDTPTDITATSCGHLFCHTCLMEALIAGENRSTGNEPKRSQCPVCRKNISRTKSADTIPLLLMKKGAVTQPRKQSPNTGDKKPEA